jgi:hypothetical protein
MGLFFFTARFADCELRFRPFVRVLFSIVVILTHVWELVLLGMQAQRLADASVVHASSVWKFLGSSKEEKVEKGPPPSDGCACESTVMLI